MNSPWMHWDFHPSVVLGLAGLGGLYVFWGGRRLARRRQVSFGAALFVLFAVLNGPVHELSDHYLFSVHMGQHLVLTLLFPPLLLVGLGPDQVRPVLRLPGVATAARLLTRPLIAAGIFTAVLGVWHTTAFYEAAMRHHALHIVQHLFFLAASVLMWWPILSPVPELPRLPHAAQLLYLFFLGIPMSIVGAMITLADRLLYPFYAAAPRISGFTPLADQQLGGLIMWIPGGVILLVAMTVVWFRWSAREEQEEPEPVVPAAPHQ